MNSFTLVRNINTPNSASLVQTALQQIKDITDVIVSPQQGKVSFRYSNDRSSLTVIETLKSLGFPPKGEF